MRPDMLVTALLMTTVALVAANLESDHLSDAGRGKKEEKMMQNMLQAMMLAKNMISFLLMFVSPIMQIKGFGLSVVNTLINISRFIVQLQATQEMKKMNLAHLKIKHAYTHEVSHNHNSEDLWAHEETHNSEEPWSSSSNRYAYYAPPPKTFLQHHSGVKSLPSTHSTYISPGHHQNIYPNYSSNYSQLR